ncbi:hypothetical protein HanHA300_Chr13g0475931 [Helianthus annuus]|nr:hypothetical protein HanHA300_Chr13g0475931 [Helianthus annuus]KAJ0663146.1 hypothetical protein HanLR1_Chr13g0478031 [Helianthus annuus]
MKRLNLKRDIYLQIRFPHIIIRNRITNLRIPNKARLLQQFSKPLIINPQLVILIPELRMIIPPVRFLIKLSFDNRPT